MRNLIPHETAYFNSLDELYDTAEMVAGNEDYIVIHVDRRAFDEVQYFKDRYYKAKFENKKAIWGE